MGTRRRRSTTEWQTLVELENRSKVTTHQFCKEQELNYKYYSKQKNKLKRLACTERETNGFIKLEEDSVLKHVSQTVIEIIYRESRVRLSTEIDPRWLSPLLKGIVV